MSTPESAFGVGAVVALLILMIPVAIEIAGEVIAWFREADGDWDSIQTMLDGDHE